jgi:hypothetical protein
MRYDFIFITAALACLLTGMSMGIWMGIARMISRSPRYTRT